MWRSDLPVPADSLVGNFLNLNLNNPPAVPNYRSPDPGLDNYIPLFAAACAIEIQNNAQNNAARVFMFNLYSQNNYANREFEMLVIFMTDYTLMGLMKRAISNPEEVLNGALAEVVTMFCSNLVRDFPALERYLDVQALHAARDNVRDFDRIAAELEQMMRGNNNRGGYQQNNQRGGNFDSRYTRHYEQPVQRSYGNHSHQRGTSMSHRGNSGVFTPNENDRSKTSTWRGGSQVQDRPSPRSGHNKALAKLDEMVKNTVYWKPGMEWEAIFGKSFILHNPTEFVMGMLMKDGVIQEIEINEKGALTNMDYDQHETSVFGKPSTAQIAASKIINKSLDAGIDDLKPVDEIPGLNSAPGVAESTMVEPSLELVLFNGDVKRKLAGLPFVYHIRASVETPFCTMEDNFGRVKDLASSTTYAELVSKMKKLRNVMDVGIFSAINKRLTASINRVINQRLSIAALTIDSFVDDYMDLEQYFIDTYGKKSLDGLRVDERGYICALLCTIENAEDHIKEAFSYEYLRESGAGDKMNYVILLDDYTVTYLDCDAVDLVLDMNKKASSIIVPLLTPEFSKLAEFIVESGTQMECASVTRNFIRTNDNRMFEISRGAMFPDSLMVSIIE